MSTCIPFLAAVALSAFACMASAQTFPAGPIKVVVPSGPGGIIDPVARFVQERFQRVFGQPFVIDHKPGAGGALGTQIVQKAPADGYTLLMANSGPLMWNPAINPKLPYQMERDFVPVGSLVSVTNLVVVHPSVPANTLKEFIELAKKSPGTLNFASPGVGQSAHLAGEMLKRVAGIDLVHVPFSGGPAALNGILAGQVHIMTSNVGTAMPHVKAGKLRALAVTDTRRSAAMPEVPTTAEAGVPGFVISPEIWVAAPAGTPESVVARMHDEMKKAWATPEGQQVLQRYELSMDEERNRSLANLSKHLSSENAKWAKLIKDANIKQD
ncbi:Bug family tripartite tricarboxylate transporter substrate binding protein [Ramlibacter sp.]|uniref:Bug family tripartite tricarboxylate transporter substrate binding protein n=1 Tax=Ramlibacter sp. TaxID=1917967 RepID=UPI003D0C5F4A